MSTMQCPICFERCTSDETKTWSALKDCGHVYHTECLKQSLEYNQKCALCRAKISTSAKAPGHFPIRLNIVACDALTPGASSQGAHANDPAMLARISALEQKLRDCTTELQQEKERLQSEAKQREELETAIQEVNDRAAREAEKARNELQDLRIKLHNEKMANQKRVAAHKVALDTVQKDRDRLQRLVDIHQIRNDTGLGAAELDRAVSRLMAGGPALSATQKKTLHDLTATIKERNQDYNDLVHKTQQLAREKDADKRRADDRIYSLTEEVKALKAKHKQQAKRIQELEEAAQPVLHGQHAQQLMHNSVAAPAPVLQVPPQIMWNPSPDETDELCKRAASRPSTAARAAKPPKAAPARKASAAAPSAASCYPAAGIGSAAASADQGCQQQYGAQQPGRQSGQQHPAGPRGWDQQQHDAQHAQQAQQAARLSESSPLVELDTCLDDYMLAEPYCPAELLGDEADLLDAQHAQRTLQRPAVCDQSAAQQQQGGEPADPDLTDADESDVKMREAPREETEDADLTQAFAGPQHGAGAPSTLIGSEDLARLEDEALAYLESHEPQGDDQDAGGTAAAATDIQHPTLQAAVRATEPAAAGPAGHAGETSAGATVDFGREPLAGGARSPPVASTSYSAPPLDRARRLPLLERIKRLKGGAASHSTAAVAVAPAGVAHAGGQAAAAAAGRGNAEDSINCQPPPAKVRLVLPSAPSAAGHRAPSGRSTAQQAVPHFDKATDPQQACHIARGVYDLEDDMDCKFDKENVSQGALPLSLAAALAGGTPAGSAGTAACGHKRQLDEVHDWSRLDDGDDVDDSVAGSQPGQDSQHGSHTQQLTQTASNGAPWQSVAASQATASQPRSSQLLTSRPRSSQPAGCRPSTPYSNSDAQVQGQGAKPLSGLTSIRRPGTLAAGTSGGSPWASSRVDSHAGASNPGFLSGPGYLSGLGPAERDPSLRQHHHSMAAAASREKSFLPHGAAGVGAANGGGTFIRHGPDGTGKRVLVLGNTLQEPRGQAAAAPSMRAQMAKKAAGGPMKRGKAGKQKPLSSDSGNILKFFSATGR